jgi:prophage regulatory protein
MTAQAEVWRKVRQRILAALCIAAALGAASSLGTMLSAPPGAKQQQQAAVVAGVAIIRRKELLQMLGVSNTTLWAWIKENDFPRPIDIGPNTRAGLTEEVAVWLEARKAARDRQLASAE